MVFRLTIPTAWPALYDVQLRHRDEPDLWLAFGSRMTIAAGRITALEEVEQETSMILGLRPELVRMEAARGAPIPFGSAFCYPDFSGPGLVDVPRAFDGLSETGAFLPRGSSRLASRRAGRGDGC